MDQEGGGVEVDIPLRTQERDQLAEFHPQIIDHLNELGLDKEGEQVSDVELAIEEAPELDGYSYRGYAHAEEWRTLLSALQHLYDEETLRVRWLRKKLAKRLHDRVQEIEEAINDG